MTSPSQPHHRSARAIASVVLVAIAWLAGCRANNPIIVPNRVLDRPLDVVLACVRRTEDDTVEVLSLNTCNGAGTGDCEAVDEPQLVGFVANTETNEIGMFRRCDQNGMVDLDPEAPGYNLVPVGSMPSRIVRTEDCRVVTANWGSCDLGAVDLPGLASYAVGVAPDGAPSSLVTRIEPRRGDGTLLGASPGDLVAVPRELSLAEGGGGGFDTDAACDPEAPASVYVTFPTCQLVAEVDLSTQRILQSRQFVTDEDGVVSLVDTGPDPQCPLECAEQFDTVPTDRPPVDDDGVFPIALALVRAQDSLSGGQDSLFVGGTGSDEVFQLDIVPVPGSTTSNAFVPPADTRRLLLENPAGVQGIRVTPIVTIDGAQHQFLYVIAGDGSTHVVDRAEDVNTLGVECDTQVDPAVATSRACHEIDPGSQASNADRRPFAAGPGIRGPVGSTITDWTFQISEVDSEPTTAPFGSDGVVGIGVTSFGRVVLVVFNQYDEAEPTIASVDPLGLMSVEIRPHMLWPIVDPANGDPSVFPLVDDEEPRRVLPSEDNATQVLAPALRRIDLAYTAEAADTGGGPEDQTEQDEINLVLGEPDNEDRLGSPDGEAFYETSVVRSVVRDYRQWRGGQTWRLLWEGQIPSTESATGRIQCDTPNPNTNDPDVPGEEAGTCHATAEQPVRLIDEGAQFCDDGVLPGDKLVLFGCGGDDECGVGRRCLRDPSAGGSTSGICVSALAYDNELEELRRACAPFIADPCGAPRREYVVTSATQTELAFASIDIPPTTFQREVCPVPTGEDNVLDSYGPKPAPIVSDECEARLTCALPVGEQAPSGGCASDDECDGLGESNGAEYICIEGVCRTPCEGGSLNCRQIVLPGPKCFAEFVRYAITLRDSFLVQVDPAASFLPERVLADPDTGQCREDPTVSNLLTSRLPLGLDEDATFEQIPDCPASEDASPADPNPCRITAARGASGGAVYHYFSYNTNQVSAVRFSNPFGTFVLDLVSLIDLATPTGSEVDDAGNTRYFHWSDQLAQFRRARIPRNYREEFTTPQVTGYQTFNDPVIVQNTALTYPVRIVSAPELAAAYIVDAGGLGGVAGVRGQVMRVTISNSEIRGDENFRVR